MHNDFILVGPESDPARLSESANIKEAFGQLSKGNVVFISRADDSGTNKKELTIWNASGIEPYGNNWYFEAGVGIAEVLRMTSDRKSYTMTDRGSWLALKDKLALKIILSGDEILKNPYGVIAVNPKKHKTVNFKAARQFIDWLLSKKIQKLIGEYRVHGEQLFIPHHL